MSQFNLKWFPSQVLRLEVDTQTANFTAESGKLHVVNPAGASLNIQLPAPSANFHCVIKDLSGDLLNKTVTIVRNGVENIDGVASNYQLESDKESVQLFSDGTDWFLI